MGIRAQPREIDVPKDDPFKHDLLDRREAVDTLTHLVANVDGPCVLGVDAAWGAGKTTFLRIWTQHLRNEGFPVVEFNEKWSPFFGQCCKVDSALMRGVYDDGEATEFLIGFQSEGGAGGDPRRQDGGGAAGALPSSASTCSG